MIPIHLKPFTYHIYIYLHYTVCIYLCNINHIPKKSPKTRLVYHRQFAPCLACWPFDWSCPSHVEPLAVGVLGTAWKNQQVHSSLKG